MRSAMARAERALPRASSGRPNAERASLQCHSAYASPSECPRVRASSRASSASGRPSCGRAMKVRAWPRVDRGVTTRSRSPESARSEEHTSELQSRLHLVCRLLLEKKKTLTAPYDSVHNESKLPGVQLED